LDRKPISTFAINQNTNDDGQSKPQVCNPPFVYSLAWSKDGTSLSAGLGDGTVGVFEINNRTLVQSELLRGSEGADGTMHFAHESSVASVVYPSFSAPTSSRILCSAGSDGAVVFWDLGKPPNDEDWTDDIETVTTTRKKNHDTYSDDAVAQLFPHGLLQNLRNTHAAESLNTTSGTPLGYKPRILFDIPHGEKINWVTPAAPSSGTASSEYSDTIFVADTSSDITSYTIPL
jgi:WD40 repeat protein